MLLIFLTACTVMLHSACGTPANSLCTVMLHSACGTPADSLCTVMLHSGCGTPADSLRRVSVRTDSSESRLDSLRRSAATVGRGAGFGIDMNSLAGETSAGLQVLAPLSSRFAIVARPMLAGGASSRDLDVGGRVEVQLRSPIYENHLRVYVGVGPQGFYELRGQARHSRDFSGGWDVGAEVFVSPRFGAHWEMGTSGGDVTSGAGPAFSVGFRVYPWGG